MNEADKIDEWKQWNLAGFIPGPEEDESSFKKRIDFCLNLKLHLSEKMGIDLPFDLDDPTAQTFIEEVLPQTETLYGIRPDWVLLFFSNHQLTPWHGGCAWIFQLDEQAPTAAFLQLRKQFKDSPAYLGLYQRSELIIHELAHVGRMLYQEPQFEEIFAYQSSSSKWRRWLGPIVQSSTESLLFMFVLGVMIMADVALLTMGHGGWDSFGWWIKLAPFILIVAALGRLFSRHRTYHSCLRHLESLYPPETARHLMYRLTDSEIHQFAALSPAEISQFIAAAKVSSFRWNFLTTTLMPL